MLQFLNQFLFRKKSVHQPHEPISIFDMDKEQALTFQAENELLIIRLENEQIEIGEKRGQAIRNKGKVAQQLIILEIQDERSKRQSLSSV